MAILKALFLLVVCVCGAGAREARSDMENLRATVKSRVAELSDQFRTMLFGMWRNFDADQDRGFTVDDRGKLEVFFLNQLVSFLTQTVDEHNKIVEAEGRSAISKFQKITKEREMQKQIVALHKYTMDLFDNIVASYRAGNYEKAQKSVIAGIKELAPQVSGMLSGVMSFDTQNTSDIKRLHSLIAAQLLAAYKQFEMKLRSKVVQKAEARPLKVSDSVMNRLVADGGFYSIQSAEYVRGLIPRDLVTEPLLTYEKQILDGLRESVMSLDDLEKVVVGLEKLEKKFSPGWLAKSAQQKREHALLLPYVKLLIALAKSATTYLGREAGEFVNPVK